MKFKLWSYDVWGNARDGFEVNDRRPGGIYSMEWDDRTTDQEILDDLFSDGIITKHAVKNLEIDGDLETVLYFNNKKNGRPEFELTREDGPDLDVA